MLRLIYLKTSKRRASLTHSRRLKLRSETPSRLPQTTSPSARRLPTFPRKRSRIMVMGVVAGWTIRLSNIGGWTHTGSCYNGGLCGRIETYEPKKEYKGEREIALYDL